MEDLGLIGTIPTELGRLSELGKRECCCFICSLY